MLDYHSLFFLKRRHTKLFATISYLQSTRLDSVWSARINTMTEKRDKYGRRIYIFRLGSSFTVYIVL